MLGTLGPQRYLTLLMSVTCCLPAPLYVWRSCAPPFRDRLQLYCLTFLGLALCTCLVLDTSPSGQTASSAQLQQTPRRRRRSCCCCCCDCCPLQLPDLLLLLLLQVIDVTVRLLQSACPGRPSEQ